MTDMDAKLDEAKAAIHRKNLENEVSSLANLDCFGYIFIFMQEFVLCGFIVDNGSIINWCAVSLQCAEMMSVFSLIFIVLVMFLISCPKNKFVVHLSLKMEP